MNEILEKSLLKKIERLEAFEDRMKIRIEKISIRMPYDDEYFELFLEVHPIDGNTIKEDVRFESVVYDLEGSILALEYHDLYEDKFFGYDTFKFNFSISHEKIGKIRVYPKKR